MLRLRTVNHAIALASTALRKRSLPLSPGERMFY